MYSPQLRFSTCRAWTSTGRARAYSDQVEGSSRHPLLPLHRGDLLAQPDPLRVCYGLRVGHSCKLLAVAVPLSIGAQTDLLDLGDATTTDSVLYNISQL